MKVLSILEKTVTVYTRNSEILPTHMSDSLCSKLLKLSELYLEHNRENAIIYFRTTPPLDLSIEREEAFSTLV